MKFKYTIAIIACAAILVGGVTTYIYHNNKPTEIEVHGLIPERSQQELILNSDIIVKGTVSEIGDGKWSNPDFKIKGKNNIIQTDITVAVEKLLSGTYEKEDVIVRIDKGYDKESNTKIISDGYPDFKVGENVVLFLSRDDGEFATKEDYFVLTGMLQGKWTLSENGGLIPPVTADYSLKNQSLSALEAEIHNQQKANPNWKAQKAIEKEKIRKQNIELFGE